MIIERWTGPPVETHAYLVADEATGEAWAIDAPLETARPILARVRERGWRLARLVLTHGHFDHVLDLERYLEAGVPIAAHPLERPLLEAPQTELFGLPYRMPTCRIDEELGEGMRLPLGAESWEVWHVPGHSPGHVALHCPARGVLLSGDLLFQGGFGRVDLPGADAAAIAESLRRVLRLPPDTRIYPGHGPETTVGAERPWLAPMLASLTRRSP